MVNDFLEWYSLQPLWLVLCSVFLLGFLPTLGVFIRLRLVAKAKRAHKEYSWDLSYELERENQYDQTNDVRDIIYGKASRRSLKFAPYAATLIEEFKESYDISEYNNLNEYAGVLIAAYQKHLREYKKVTNKLTIEQLKEIVDHTVDTAQDLSLAEYLKLASMTCKFSGSDYDKNNDLTVSSNRFLLKLRKNIETFIKELQTEPTLESLPVEWQVPMALNSGEDNNDFSIINVSAEKEKTDAR